MDIQIKVFEGEGIDVWALGQKIKALIEEMGFDCYSSGYNIVDHYRELVFNKKKGRKKSK